MLSRFDRLRLGLNNGSFSRNVSKALIRLKLESVSVMGLGITFLCSADSVDPSTLVGWSQFQYLRELLFAPEAVDQMEEMWLSMKKFDHGVDRSSNASDLFVVAAFHISVVKRTCSARMNL